MMRRGLGYWGRAWQRFRQQRRAWWSLILFAVLFALSLGAELLSNDRPLLVKYQGEYYYPLMRDYPETVFGGDFPTPADYLDPFIPGQLGHLPAQSLWPEYDQLFHQFAQSGAAIG